MQPDLVEWACNIETHVCQMLDRHVLNALICIGLALFVIWVGWIIDMIIADLKRNKGKRPPPDDGQYPPAGFA